MKTLQRTIFIFLAILIILPQTISTPSYALDVYVEEFGTDDNFKINVTGNPSPLIFQQDATYKFEVSFTDGFTLYITSPLLNTTDAKIKVVDATLDTTTQIISASGLKIEKINRQSGNKGEAWMGKDTFWVKISNVGDSISGQVIEQKMTNTSGNTITSVTKNTPVAFEFLIVDPQTASNNYKDKSAFLSVTGGSFIQENYNITIEKTDFVVDGVRRVAFKVKMPYMRYTGEGNTLAFSIRYRTTNDMTIPPRQLVISTEWSQCVEGAYNPTDDVDDGKQLDPITPYIIVESFNYGGDSVTGGENFVLDLVLRNTSSQYTLQNVVMNVTPTGVYNLTSSSNTYYLKNLFAGSSTMRSLSLRADLTQATSGSEAPKANAVEIKFTYQYVANSARISATSSETITIPVSFPDRLEFNTSEVPNAMVLGETMDVSIPIINKGRTSAYNVEAVIGGDVMSPGRVIYVGNVNNGSEQFLDFEIGFEEAGQKTCEILITYEDANMKKVEKSVIFGVTVEEPPVYDPSMFEEAPPEIPASTQPKAKLPNSTYYAGAAACALSAFLTIKKGKAQRSELLNEDI